MIRGLSYLFLFSDKRLGYSVLSRIILILSLLIILILSRSVHNFYIYISYPIIILASEFVILTIIGRLRKVLSGIFMIAIFILIGIIIQLINVFLRLPAPGLTEIIIGSFRLTAFFIGFTLIFQLINVREWRSILSRLGLTEHAQTITMVLAQIPVILTYFSEALVTLRLKYKGRKIFSAITPLIYYTAQNSRNIIETYIMYPMKESRENINLFNKKDLLIYIYIISLITPLAIS
jgi:hypothetical protein